MYYQPISKVGTPIRLPWQLRSFFSNIFWPLSDSPSKLMKILDKFIISFSFLSFLIAVEAALQFFIHNLNDIILSTEAFSNLVIYNDSVLRLFRMSLRKDSYKKLLIKFYAEINIDESQDPEMNKIVQKTIVPINIYSAVYITSFLTFVIGPVISAFLYNTRLLPHRLDFHFGLENPYVYGLVMVQLTYNGLSAALFVTGEICMLGNFVGFLCARFDVIQNVLQESALTLSGRDSSKVAEKFRRVLDESIAKTNKLIEFAEEMQNLYSFQFFIMISHSTLMLCVLIYQASISQVGSAKFVSYVTWMMAKMSELLILGALGSRLKTTTNNISSMFYHCNWEIITNRSTNQKQNVFLMKQVYAAILLYHKEIELNGFGFFSVSLETAASLIQGAGSYFMALQAFSKT